MIVGGCLKMIFFIWHWHLTMRLSSSELKSYFDIHKILFYVNKMGLDLLNRDLEGSNVFFVTCISLYWAIICYYLYKQKCVLHCLSIHYHINIICYVIRGFKRLEVQSFDHWYQTNMKCFWKVANNVVWNNMLP